MILHLHSDDGNAGDSPWDFTVNLPRIIPLSQNRWEVALVDIKLFGRKTNFEEELYVMTDIAEHETYAAGAFRPLLGVVGKSGRIIDKQPLTVSMEYLHRIRIYIRRRSMAYPSISTSAVRVTLLVKRK